MKMSPGKVALHTQIDGRLMSLAKREAMERRIPLRAVVEAGTVLTLAVRPNRAADVRAMLERITLALLYLGLPGWLLLHAGW